MRRHRILLPFLLVMTAAVWPQSSRADDGPTLTFGGFVVGKLDYDTNRAATRPWLDRVDADKHRGVTSVDPLGTRLSLKAVHAVDGVQGEGFVEVDFKPGPPRLRHAYAAVRSDFGSLLAGQTWTLIGMHGPTTFNFDWMLFLGNPYGRVPQLRYTKSFDAFTVHLALVRNDAGNGSSIFVIDPTFKAAATIGDNELPLGQARVELKVMDKGFVAMAGSAGQMRIGVKPDGAALASSEKLMVSLVTLDF